MVFVFNASSVWVHAAQGMAQGRAVVLDFVGLGKSSSYFLMKGADYIFVNSQCSVETATSHPRFLHHISTATACDHFI
jgi:uncharacterized NAD-dependent epimerase/dehydratase family protein